MKTQVQVCVHPVRCDCESCEEAWLEWASSIHDAEVLSHKDVIDEATWRQEFRDWVERQS